MKNVSIQNGITSRTPDESKIQDSKGRAIYILGWACALLSHAPVNSSMNSKHVNFIGEAAIFVEYVYLFLHSKQQKRNK